MMAGFLENKIKKKRASPSVGKVTIVTHEVAADQDVCGGEVTQHSLPEVFVKGLPKERPHIVHMRPVYLTKTLRI